MHDIGFSKIGNGRDNFATVGETYFLHLLLFSITKPKTMKVKPVRFEFFLILTYLLKNSQCRSNISGADGSARLFDLRNLQHSTIVYEDPLRTPLMRLAWNKQDSNYLATFAEYSVEVKAIHFFIRIFISLVVLRF